MTSIALQILEGHQRGRTYSDLPTPITIGREEDNAIRLNDERASRFHAKIQTDDGRVILTDLDSTNGTRVNGHLVQMRVLQPGDVLLVEGNTRVSAAIKYLTQSTWSHAALYVGERVPEGAPRGIGTGADEPLHLIEANLGEGCVAVPLGRYESYNTRICRAVALTPEDREAVCRYAVSKLGLRYDLKNILDMARWFLPTPPVPVRWRRRMIALGSGEPTRAICSTIIAQGFQSIRYPILPRIERLDGHRSAASRYARREVLHIRHHSLFTPRDFDLSPYFEVVKPTISHGFDYKRLEWADGEARPARA